MSKHVYVYKEKYQTSTWCGHRIRWMYADDEWLLLSTREEMIEDESMENRVLGTFLRPSDAELTARLRNHVLTIIEEGEDVLERVASIHDVLTAMLDEVRVADEAQLLGMN